jgi:hypothetical protein
MDVPTAVLDQAAIDGATATASAAARQTVHEDEIESAEEAGNAVRAAVGVRVGVGVGVANASANVNASEGIASRRAAVSEPALAPGGVVLSWLLYFGLYALPVCPREEEPLLALSWQATWIDRSLRVHLARLCEGLSLLH